MSQLDPPQHVLAIEHAEHPSIGDHGQLVHTLCAIKPIAPPTSSVGDTIVSGAGVMI